MRGLNIFQLKVENLETLLFPPLGDIETMEEELQRSFSPPPCPSTVTVRRNPPRRARATPFTTAPKPPSASANTHDVPAFPIDEILSIQIPQSERKSSVPESLKIFLRIKPLKTVTKVTTTKSRPRNVWPQNPSKKNNAKESRDPGNAKKKKSEEACIALNDPYSVTLTPPQALQELKRSKTEVYEGFSHVFPADCSQVRSNLISISLHFRSNFELGLTFVFVERCVWYNGSTFVGGFSEREKRNVGSIGT